MGMSEEQKKAMADGRARAKAAKEAAVKDTESASDIKSEETVEVKRSEIESVLKAAQTPQVIQVAATTPQVRMRFIAEVSDENVTELGDNAKYGRFSGATWIASVPHDAFVGDFRTSQVREMMANRMLVVLDGLTDDERKMYGVDYYDGEVLDEKYFQQLINMGDEILDIYPKLCDGQKDAVAARFIGEYEKNKQCLSRDIVIKLNKLSKMRYADDDPRKVGDFHTIIRQMNIDDEMEE